MGDWGLRPHLGNHKAVGLFMNIGMDIIKKNTSFQCWANMGPLTKHVSLAGQWWSTRFLWYGPLFPPNLFHQSLAGIRFACI